MHNLLHHCITYYVFSWDPSRLSFVWVQGMRSLLLYVCKCSINIANCLNGNISAHWRDNIDIFPLRYFIRIGHFIFSNFLTKWSWTGKKGYEPDNTSIIKQLILEFREGYKEERNQLLSLSKTKEDKIIYFVHQIKSALNEKNVPF